MIPENQMMVLEEKKEHSVCAHFGVLKHLPGPVKAIKLFCLKRFQCSRSVFVAKCWSFSDS